MKRKGITLSGWLGLFNESIRMNKEKRQSELAHKPNPKRQCPHCHGSLERYEDPKAIALLRGVDLQLLAMRADRNRLFEACKAAKKYLEPELSEPGRTVFWQLVEAIILSDGGPV